jgi:tetratricopeptide (TPR) repeat protein
LWERAAQAAAAGAEWAPAIGHAGRARDHYLQHGQARAAARAQATAGRALRLWGHFAEAREQLTAALEVLRADPDADTVRALDELATVEVFADSPGADRLTTEALTLGQALNVDARQLSSLFIARGIYLIQTARRPEAVAYLRESARLATQASDNFRLGRALLNLSSALSFSDPGAAAEAARTAAGHLRRAGIRDFLAVAIMNLAYALLVLGDWDDAEQELTQAMNSDGLADDDFLACELGWLAALRGDTTSAEIMLARLRDMRTSEDPQDKSLISLVEAFTSAARHQPQDALRSSREAFTHARAHGSTSDYLCWAWPLAARAAHDLDDIGTERQLVTLLDSSQPGWLAPMLRAECDLALVRLASGDGAGAASFAAAIDSLRELSTPYHLAHGLLDHAEYLTRQGDTEAAEAAVAEARAIASRLRCQPLLDRAAALTLARPSAQT